MSDSFSPEPSFELEALLESADNWRTAARAAIEEGAWSRVTAALDLAETTYDSAIGMGQADPPDPMPPIFQRLAEGRALCTVLRADVALRHWQIPEAEARIDEAYRAFKTIGDGVVGAELWRMTARLAERQGRWRSAIAAWKRVVKKTEGEDEVALGDALIRLAEVQLIDGHAEKAEETLSRVEALVRDLDDDLLSARVSAARAAELESRQEYAAAWEAWHDAQSRTLVAPADFSGLLKLRMAGTAVWMKPRQGFRLVERGYEALVSANHPDALGLAYHQLAVLALAVRDAGAASLALVGARMSRQGYDETSAPMLAQALRQGGHEAAADRVLAHAEDPSDTTGVTGPKTGRLPNDRTLLRALEAETVERGLKWAQIGTEEGLLVLCAGLRRGERSRALVKVDGEQGWEVVDRRAFVRHRATLAWDAPMATLARPEPPRPTVAPTPRPAPRREPRAYADASLAQGTPHRVPERSDLVEWPAWLTVAGLSPLALLLGAFAVILLTSGSLAVGLLLLLWS
jgi:tetratricopeptide (TPR) repeat protein